MLHFYAFSPYNPPRERLARAPVRIEGGKIRGDIQWIFSRCFGHAARCVCPLLLSLSEGDECLRFEFVPFSPHLHRCLPVSGAWDGCVSRQRHLSRRRCWMAGSIVNNRFPG
ncbi:unnamed protein product [Effrenium voratum]|nr:unnamed protein product [Effrenium voratum]CAJ1444268.1 unnamed protein product [Effrenium voratum]